MKNISYLIKAGFLPEHLHEVALMWAKNPTRFNLTPTMFRFMHDAIIKSVPLEQCEARFKISARSAKCVLKMNLIALLEADGLFWKTGVIKELQEDSCDETAANNHNLQFGTTRAESLILEALLKSRGRWCSLERLMTQYSAHKSSDEQPSPSVVTAHIVKLRKKVASKYTIKTGYLLGYMIEKELP